MLVPGYIGYKLSGYIWGYIAGVNKNDPAAQNATVDPKEAKRLAKKEKKESKGEKVKFIRK